MASGPLLVVRLPAGPDGALASLPVGPTTRVPVTRACGHVEWITVQWPADLPVAWGREVRCAACRGRRGRRL